MFYMLCLHKNKSVTIESEFVMVCQNLFSDFVVQCNSKAVPRQIITFDKNKSVIMKAVPRFVVIKPKNINFVYL